MTPRRHGLVVLLALATLTCQGGQEPTPDPAPIAAPSQSAPVAGDDLRSPSLATRARAAAALAREIQGRPDGAETILEAHGLTVDDFEALLFEIAADPQASEIYAGELEP